MVPEFRDGGGGGEVAREERDGDRELWLFLAGEAS